MSNELKSCVDYYLELLSVDLSRLSPLQFFSPNILGTVCFLHFTKTKTEPYGLNIWLFACLFICLQVPLFASHHFSFKDQLKLSRSIKQVLAQIVYIGLHSIHS